MAARRVVVVSMSDIVDIEQTTNDTTKSNESVSSNRVVYDMTTQSDETLSRKYSLLSLQGQEETWFVSKMKANAEVTTITEQKFPIFGPKVFQNQYEKGFFFKNEEYLKHGRTVVLPLAGIIINLVFYLFLDMEVIVLVSNIISTSSIFPILIALYGYTYIKTADGRPGSALKVFSMLNENERLLLSKRHLSFNSLVMIMYLLGIIPQIIYFVLRFENVATWCQVVFIIAVICVFFPYFAIYSVLPLFCYTADITDRLFAQRKIFVYNQFDGRINWVAVQQNFDVLESIVKDISNGFQMVFIASMVFAIAFGSMLVGIISQILSWHAADYQPKSMVLLLIAEIFHCVAQLFVFVSVWSAGSQITAACDGVVDQCSNVLAFIRMSPSFHKSTDEYKRAKLFHAYVKEANLGFKVFGIRISFTLAINILAPLVSVLSVVLPLVFKLL